MAVTKQKVFFDVSLNGKKSDKLKRIVFELYNETVPRTAENFYRLCTGFESNGKQYSYKNSIFHRVIPQFMVQGGDITAHNGTGGRSFYGERFKDENFSIKHTKPFLLSMANAGPNTNGSQFFITTVPCPWLDGKHVVFGEVVEGNEAVLEIEKVRRNGQDKPFEDVVIVECGEIK